MIYHFKKTLRNRSGFTLIELIVVVVIIGLLAGLVLPQYIRQEEKAKLKAARAQIELLGLALDAYRLDTGDYPTTEQGLAALWEQPTAGAPLGWRGAYTRKGIPLDSWGRGYVYRGPPGGAGAGYDLLSYGKDGEAGGEGEEAGGPAGGAGGAAGAGGCTREEQRAVPTQAGAGRRPCGREGGGGGGGGGGHAR